MHFEKLFPSRFVRASDIEDKGEVHLTVRGVRVEDVHNRENNTKEQKPILYFFGSNKGLVLNRTNAETIAKLHGPDTEQWAGKRISLYVERGVRAFGRVWDTVTSLISSSRRFAIVQFKSPLQLLPFLYS